MQLSYLPLAWLKNIEQSIVKKQLIVKLDTALPQILTLMKIAIAPIRLSCTAFFRIVPQLEGNSCQA
ncbi:MULTISPECIES: hypothetical protein [unclassified Nostoc]|uniref:hypothetical protein n=1 Tax=unclassified Nostoc TaxID=2593658 RepID=UPI002AD23042|nr:hypothetical protein [Nostoc sp. DedQUE03]MDZ7972654.1 hypothetical protein [Nostoc sp. DedQUE03]MDZ8046016.1 hypothetical protein [Nostoc sp. DedQUE02]